MIVVWMVVGFVVGLFVYLRLLSWCFVRCVCWLRVWFVVGIVAGSAC